MASIKIKFRPSTIDGKEGSIYLQITHNRVVRQLNTNYKIFPEEWDDKKEKIIVSGERINTLKSIKEQLNWDIVRLGKVMLKKQTECGNYTTDDIIEDFHELEKEDTLFTFMHRVIAQLKLLGKVRTAETYTSTLYSFMGFRECQDIPLESIDSYLMLLYEAYLKDRGLRMNTISFYMRILRATYNRAVEKGLTKQRHPFRHVYTGIEKTVKRAVPIKTMKALKNLNLSAHPKLEFARDMFMFSFYTRGMSFVDMAYLKKKDLQNGILTYRRRKTGQELCIKWEKCMADIVAKHPSGESMYLLPIIKKTGYERKQYENAMHIINHHLKEITQMLNLPRPLTMYVARHSWASAAKAKNIPLAIISEGMGHESEATTKIYLASIETTVVDRANKMILGLL